MEFLEFDEWKEREEMGEEEGDEPISVASKKQWAGCQTNPAHALPAPPPA